MTRKESVTIFWFRRDLRLTDNAGLYRALSENQNVLPLFIFDLDILELLEEKYDGRVDFIHQALFSINEKLLYAGSTLEVIHDRAFNAFITILEKYDVKKVYTNHDYEPAARERDEKIGRLLESRGIEFITCKDQCIFEKSEVVKNDGSPYTVFTPYSRKWKEKLRAGIPEYPSEKFLAGFFKCSYRQLPTLKSLGFGKTGIVLPENVTTNGFNFEAYRENRDIPGLNGTSRLSVHLRFGTISIRKLAAEAILKSETFLNELIWRDFYMMIMWHFPHAAKNSFKKEYDSIKWRNNENEFYKWCRGETGFKLVDAGMRELNKTGFMHNRVRMIVSSFLVKDLLVDWRWGEAYFASRLLDFDLCANNGGWQWAAGSGCDAAPYFRIFNPATQLEKFDPQLAYVSKWLPGHNSEDYPQPMVDHAQARLRALEVYKKSLSAYRLEKA